MIFGVLTETGWRPGIGDPSFMGWFTVFAYFAGSFLCWKAARSVPAGEMKKLKEQRLFWFGLAVFLFLLGINKQLDLQTWFTLAGRNVAMQQGWYEQRRMVQFLFITALLGAALIAFMIAGWLVRHAIRPNLLPLAGAVFLGVFIMVRAASFHHVDKLLGFEPGGFRMNWVLELSGILLIVAGAWRTWGRQKKAMAQPAQPAPDFIWVTAPPASRRSRKTP